MPMFRHLGLCLICVACLFVGARRSGGADDLDAGEFFEKRIRPVLVEQCHRCHSAEAEKLKGGLRVDSRAGLIAGGDTGPALVPGEPERSLVVRAVTYEDPDLQMPPKSRLPAKVVEDLRRWVQAGAVWPGGSADTRPAAAATGGFDLVKRRGEHWVWTPITSPEPPAVRQTSWPENDVDRFVLARLEAAGLAPAPGADRRVLVRRASFVLTGLPPTPEEVEAFVADDAPGAWERVVDRLLASPHFGEHWGRHWLDKVRFAETMGHEFDYPILGAWRYRDYVVRAFNADIPHDQFVREQIAGDLVAKPRRNPLDGGNESLLATAQYWLCQQVHSPVDVRAHQAEVIDNQIDVVTKAFLGITVSCARCHDHKFDAISTRDFYALYGILSSSRYAIRAVDDPAPRRRQAEALARLREDDRRGLAERLRVLGTEVGVAMTNLPGRVVPRAEDESLAAGGWFADGEAFTADPNPEGQPLWLGPGLMRLALPGWRHSASLSRRFQGALRSPTFTLDRDFLHLRLAGRGGRFSVVLEGFTLIRAPIYGGLRRAVQNPEPHWVTVDVSMWKGRRAWLEFSDLTAADPAAELPGEARAGDGWIAVGEVVKSELREPPPTAPPTTPSDPTGVWARWRDTPGELAFDEAAWIYGVLAAVGADSAQSPAGESPTPVEAVDRAKGERERLEAGITEPVLAGVMADGTGWDEPVFIRGNPRTPGEPVPRRFLEAVETGVNPGAFTAGSGRLALAEAMVHPENPLPARVMVNWIWSHLFGRGLVTSVDNFGVLGERPSHPELLDWLADRFRRGGGSTKALIREILRSRTWRMSSRAGQGEAGATAATPDAEVKDPDNALLHRANLRRLEAESIRDAMLAVSGGLDPTVGGPPVPIHLTPFLEGRGRPPSSGPLDGAGRRSLYVEVRRNFLSPFLLAFDLPVPATTVGRRTVSNVPAQALALMNDPFVTGEARRWAQRILREGDRPLEARIDRVYLEAFARPPTTDEAAAAREFLASAGAGEPTGNAAGAASDAAWAGLCQALFNAKEFVFVE